MRSRGWRWSRRSPPHRRADIHARILAALGSLGCGDDARMAFHAEAAGDGPAVLHHAPRAARQAAELGSHREAAAQFERALRFAADADPAVVAGLYDGLAYELMLVGRFQDAVDAGEQALGLWRQAGNRVREGGTLCNLSYALQRAGPGPGFGRRGRGRGDGPGTARPHRTELARAYASLASARMLNSRASGGDRLGGAGAGDRRAAGRARCAQRRAQHPGLLGCSHGRRVDRVPAPGAGRRALGGS